MALRFAHIPTTHLVVTEEHPRRKHVLQTPKSRLQAARTNGRRGVENAHSLRHALWMACLQAFPLPLLMTCGSGEENSAALLRGPCSALAGVGPALQGVALQGAAAVQGASGLVRHRLSSSSSVAPRFLEETQSSGLRPGCVDLSGHLAGWQALEEVGTCTNVGCEHSPAGIAPGSDRRKPSCKKICSTVLSHQTFPSHGHLH